jgi:hypothetical protein
MAKIIHPLLRVPAGCDVERINRDIIDRLYVDGPEPPTVTTPPPATAAEPKQPPATAGDPPPATRAATELTDTAVGEADAKPLPHKVQLAFDALEVLADDKTNVRGMPDDRLLELVNGQITKSTKGTVGSVSMSTMQKARRVWFKQHPIGAH